MMGQHLNCLFFCLHKMFLPRYFLKKFFFTNFLCFWCFCLLLLLLLLFETQSLYIALSVLELC